MSDSSSPSSSCKTGDFLHADPSLIVESVDVFCRMHGRRLLPQAGSTASATTNESKRIAAPLSAPQCSSALIAGTSNR
jgi:hypothetical protein